MTIDVKSLKEKLHNQIESVAKMLLPLGKRQGNEWLVGSLSGEEGKSLHLCLSGPDIGLFFDFATSQGGDIIDLWAEIQNLSFSEAINDITSYLGISKVQIISQKASNFVLPDKIKQISKEQDGFNYLINERKLTKETLQKYKIISTYKSVIFPYYKDNEVAMYKFLKIERINGKKEIRVSSDARPTLFGWQCVPPKTRKMVITEGEIDAMTLYQYGIPYAIFSLPFGGGDDEKRHKWIEQEYDNFYFYDEIYLCMDNDKVSEKTIKYLTDRLKDNIIKVVKLPFHDANECLINGVSESEIHKCFNEAKSMDPPELVNASVFLEEVMEEFYPPEGKILGYKLPWVKTHERILLKIAGVSIWTGINGHGKSELLGHIIINFMKQGAKVCIASLEIPPSELLYSLSRQAVGLKLPTKSIIEDSMKWYEDKLWLFNLTGSAKIERLLDVFKYAKHRYGINIFVIDSLLKCGLAEEDLSSQKFFLEKLCDFKNTYKVHIHLVAHPRKGSDEDKMPGKLDIKGSGSISDLADNCFSVWRNKPKERKMETYKNTLPPGDLQKEFDCVLRCDKARRRGWETSLGLYFNPDSLQFLENYDEKPKSILSHFQ